MKSSHLTLFCFHRASAVLISLVLGSYALVAHADLKSWSLTPEIVIVGSPSERALLNMRSGLGLRLQDDLLENGQWDYIFDGTFRVDTKKKFTSTQKKFEAKINSAVMQWQGDRATVAIGWQKYTWGDSAFFDGVDFLNPRDLTEPLYSDDQQNKIAVPSLNLQYLGNNTIFQTVVTVKPERTPVDDFYGGVPILKPDERTWLRGVEWGCKSGGLLKNGWDINGYLLSHAERLPQFYLFAQDPLSAQIRLNEPRVFSLGLTASQSVGDFVFRSELALHSNRALQIQGAMQSSNSDQAVFHSTADFTTLTDLLMTLEIWGEHWFVKSSERFKANSLLLGAHTHKPFWDGRFEPSAGLLMSSDRAEAWGYLKVQLKPLGSLQMSVEAHSARTSTGMVLARRGLKSLIRSSVSYQF